MKRSAYRTLWLLATVVLLAASHALAQDPPPADEPAEPVWAGPAAVITDDHIARAIQAAKVYLYSQQNAKGTWEPDLTDKDQPSIWSGRTGLVLMALLEAGEKPTDPRIKKGLDALAAMPFTPPPKGRWDTKPLYEHAFRIMALCRALGEHNDPKGVYRQVIKNDLDWLKKGNGKNTILTEGAWWYHGPDGQNGCNSCSQIALMSLSDADYAGFPLEGDVTRVLEQTWLKRQNPTGGWGYSPKIAAKDTPSMTLSGLASLYVCDDLLNVGAGAAAPHNAIQKGNDWLAANLKPADLGNNGYLAFCALRVGIASGHRLIGGVDWFDVGLSTMATRSHGHAEMGFGSVIQISFELLFMARASWPIVASKLQYGQEKDWNGYDRDLAGFTQYVGKESERPVRWQVVDANEDLQHFLDAPILMVEGAALPSLAPEQWASLREYSLRGGTLLFLPAKGGREYIQAVQKSLQDLYKPLNDSSGDAYYKMIHLEANHPIYGLLNTKASEIAALGAAAPMWGWSDGTRLLAIICERDISRAWKARQVPAGQVDHVIGTNLCMYAGQNTQFSTRMRPIMGPPMAASGQPVRVAWLKHGGNWNTQPYALEYLSAYMKANQGISIDATAGVAIDANLPAGNYKLAWITGSDAFTLDANEQAALKAYVNGGGLLFVNAVGGSALFQQSAAKMLDDLFAGKDIHGEAAPLDSLLATGKFRGVQGQPLNTLKRSAAWRLANPQLKGLQLQVYQDGSTVRAIYSAYGVHDTIDGHIAYGSMSYAPASAMDIATNIVLFAQNPAAVLAVPAGDAGGK